MLLSLFSLLQSVASVPVSNIAFWHHLPLRWLNWAFFLFQSPPLLFVNELQNNTNGPGLYSLIKMGWFLKLFSCTLYAQVWRFMIVHWSCFLGFTFSSVYFSKIYSSMPFSLIYLFFQKKIPTFFAFLRVMVWYHNHCVLCYCFWLNICAALICVTLLTFGCYGDYTAFFPAFLFSFCNFFGTLQIIRHFFFGAWNQYCSFFLNLTITNDL